MADNEGLSLKWAQRGVLGSIVAILVVSVLEFPPPVGFETRPQTDVSPLWLGLFVVILGSEIAAMILIFTRPRVGVWFAIVAGSLNIIQILADQFHLMQQQTAPLGYAMLEYTVGALSIALLYFAGRVSKLVDATALS